MTLSLKGRTLFITGASRGIGRALALRAAKDGANIAVIAKTAEPRPDLNGTIHSVAAEIRAAGGHALPLAVDIRDETALQAAIEETADYFDGIDLLVNNASALHFSGTADTPLKKYDLMMDINTRGTFVCVQACLPWLQKSREAQILTISPPLNLNSKWLGSAPAYTLSKYGMSLLTRGFAQEADFQGIAVNTLWPRSLIATDALRIHFKPMLRHARTPDIMADAAHLILSGRMFEQTGPATGQHFVDEDILRQSGIDDFSHYAIDPSKPLSEDVFLD